MGDILVNFREPDTGAPILLKHDTLDLSRGLSLDLKIPASMDPEDFIGSEEFFEQVRAEIGEFLKNNLDNFSPWDVVRRCFMGGFYQIRVEGEELEFQPDPSQIEPEGAVEAESIVPEAGEPITGTASLQPKQLTELLQTVKFKLKEIQNVEDRIAARQQEVEELVREIESLEKLHEKLRGEVNIDEAKALTEELAQLFSGLNL